jgi:hypothetical protein
MWFSISVIIPLTILPNLLSDTTKLANVSRKGLPLRTATVILMDILPDYSAFLEILVVREPQNRSPMDLDPRISVAALPHVALRPEFLPFVQISASFPKS